MFSWSLSEENKLGIFYISEKLCKESLGAFLHEGVK